jgi:hypothetical protein
LRQSDFGQYVTRFHKDPLYRAIRSSRYFNAENEKIALNPNHVANLQLLATGPSTSCLPLGHMRKCL